MWSKKLVFIIAVSVLALFLGSKFLRTKEPGQAQVVGNNSEKVVVYKSPNCGCCVGYIAYLRRQGFEVETVNVGDSSSVKEEYDIPHNMQSCHTAIIDGYFIEGHIPVEAVNRLLEEKPDIDGIALPGMPAGSAGMPGVKREEFIIYSLKGGESSEFMSI